MTLKEALSPLDTLLRQKKIGYAVIGGYAVAAWGEVRATRDIDLLCRPRDLDALKGALAESGIRFEHRAGDADDPISNVVRIEIGDADGPYGIEVLFGIREAPAGILERACRVQIEGLSVPVASPEDTILLKLLGGSIRDLDDARGILEAQAGRLDMPLIRRLCPPSLIDLLDKLVASI